MQEVVVTRISLMLSKACIKTDLQGVLQTIMIKL